MLRKTKILLFILIINFLLSYIPYYASTYNLPTSCSYEKYVIRIDDQLENPWCVAYAVCNAVETQMRSKNIIVPTGGFSKVWLYTKCKEIDKHPNEDGTYVETALKIALNEGLCPDYLLPTKDYINTDIIPILTDEMAEKASKYRISNYDKLQVDIDIVKQEIYKGNFIVISSNVNIKDWFDNDDLILSTKKTSKSFAHATYLTGYDDLRERKNITGFFDGINSWGKTWGNKGTYDMSYNYFNKNNIFELYKIEIDKKTTYPMIYVIYNLNNDMYEIILGYLKER